MFLDILSSLQGPFPHLSKKILNFLDIKSLANAELVSKAWRRIITANKCWKKHLLSDKHIKFPVPSLRKWLESSEENPEMFDTKEEWIKLYQFGQFIDSNWHKLSFKSHNLQTTRDVTCISMNTTKIVTAGITDCDSEAVLTIWDRKTLGLNQEIICGRRKILTLDCNEECIVTGSICRIQGYTGECMQSTLIVDIVTGDVLNSIDENDKIPLRQLLSFSGNPYEISFGCGLLVSYRIAYSNRRNDEAYEYHLEVRKTIGLQGVERKGGVRRNIIPENCATSTLVGHDENYVVLHHYDPPTFEVISLNDMTTTKSIEAFERCNSVQYRKGLIASASSRMGSHTQSFCAIRLYDAQSGVILNEIIEPEPIRSCNKGHLIALTDHFIVSMPDVTAAGLRVMKFRDLHKALNPISGINVSEFGCNLVGWNYSPNDTLLVDDFQLVYSHRSQTNTRDRFVDVLSFTAMEREQRRPHRPTNQKRHAEGGRF